MAESYVVDLDGTILRGDSLWEGFFALVKQRPAYAFSLLARLVTSRNVMDFKRLVFQNAVISYLDLPVNQSVLDLIETKKRQGFAIHIASGAYEGIVEQFAAHLGLSEKNFASDSNVNLTGQKKAKRLSDHFRNAEFIYIGDHKKDLHVWRVARRGLVVGTSPQRLLRRGRELGLELEALELDKPTRSPLVRMLRPHQWIKNLLVLVPVVAAQELGNLNSVANSLLAIAAFSAVASSVYITNDLMDLADDRRHSEKQHRPMAAGEVGLMRGVALAVILLSLGLMVSALASKDLLAVVASYFLVSSAYTFYFKRQPLLDVVILSILYCSRILAGGVASDIRISFWLLAFAWFFFLSLALAKRSSELRSQSHNGNQPRSSLGGRGYTLLDDALVSALGVSSATVSTVLLALFINSADAQARYPNSSYLWFLVIVIYFWLARVWMITMRGDMNSDPVLFAVRDRLSWALGLVACLTWLLTAG